MSEDEKEALSNDILRRAQEVMDRPITSEYSKGLHDGWIDALNWMLSKVD